MPMEISGKINRLFKSLIENYHCFVVLLATELPRVVMQKRPSKLPASIRVIN